MGILMENKTDTLSGIEKIKAESCVHLDELNVFGDLEYSTYSELWDFYYDLLGEAYKQGMKDAQTVEAIPVEWIKRFLEWDWDYLTNAIRFILDKWREEQDWEENATD